jgi:hypothetical protein
MALQPFCWALASSSVSWSFNTEGRAPWTSDQPVARPLPIHRTTQTQNKRKQTSKIRNYDLSVRESEGSSCLRPFGYRDRLMTLLLRDNYMTACLKQTGPSRSLVITLRLFSTICSWSRDSVVGVANGYELEDRGGRSSSLGRVENFLFSTSSRPVLEPTRPPIQWVPGALSPGVKRAGREADHSPPASAEVKRMWIYKSTLPYAFMA